MRRPALWTIRFYQRFISPALPSACRYQPTCSQYGYEAIERFGLLRGGQLTIGRLLRCTPLGRGGYDPVPDAPGDAGRPTEFSREM
jgi:putative membrane protein insertion efficiency factor